MKNLKIPVLFVCTFFLVGCEHSELTQPYALTSSLQEQQELLDLCKDNSYIDGLNIYMIEEYRSLMKEYRIKSNLEKDFSSRLMSPLDETDLRKLIFGSETNCLKTIDKLEEIYSTLGELSYVFNTIVAILDSNDPSYTFENYKESLLSREYIKYLLSNMSRYLKTAHKGLDYVLSGMLINDKNLVEAGLKIISKENDWYLNIKKTYNNFQSLLNTPPNLELFFKKIHEDIKENNLYKKSLNIENLYNKICSLIINKKEGLLFIQNQIPMKNLSRNLKFFQDFLYNLESVDKF